MLSIVSRINEECALPALSRLRALCPPLFLPRTAREGAIGSIFAVTLVMSPTISLGADEAVTLKDALVKNAHVGEAEAREISERVSTSITAELRAGNSVEISGVGRWYVQEREIRSRKKIGESGSAFRSAGASAPKSDTLVGESRRTRRCARFVSASGLKSALNETLTSGESRKAGSGGTPRRQ